MNLTIEQFAEEFLLNLKNQGFDLNKIYKNIFRTIWWDYKYRFCIWMHPNIIDLTRTKAIEEEE